MIVKQAANVLDLLEFFADRRLPATLADVSRHFDWPRSSTFNLLTTLVSRGYLYEPAARGAFYPSPLWVRHARTIEGADPVPLQLQHLLEALQQATGETAVLAVISGAHAVFVDSVESPHAIRYTAPPGKMVPLHVTATGRALLSLMSPSDRAKILRRAQFVAYTPTTLMSASAVEAEIQRSLKQGWFEGNAEFTRDLGGVAMALELPHRQFALLVAGPVYRVKDRSRELAGIMQGIIATHLEELTDSWVATTAAQPRRVGLK